MFFLSLSIQTNMKITKNHKLILLTALLLAGVDQLVKIWIWKSDVLSEPIIVVKDFFAFIKQTNYGIAFSIPLPFAIILILNVGLLAVIFSLVHKELNLKKLLSRISISLILAGGIGNLIDRIAHGYVIDYISLSIWPSFNIADVYITVGVLLILIFYGKIKLIKN